jgi:formate-dependent phosphoribosylglycinamide formyltransferase (GAR transformylase)
LEGTLGNVLMIGSSAGMLKIAAKIKAYGHYLIVMGRDNGDPCHNLANKSIFVDYRDRVKCAELAKNLEIDFIVPGSNDVAFDTSHHIAKLRNLDYFDSGHTIQMLHNKQGFRNLLGELGLAQPRVYGLEDILSSPKNLHQTTLLIKPELSFSGKGISKVKVTEHLTPAIELATKSSRNGKYIIEEFIEGDLFSVSAFLEDGKATKTFFVNEFCFTNPYAVCASFTPSTLTDELQKYVTGSVTKIAKHLNLKNGLIHIQFILDKDNTVFFIECMRRMIGDFYAKNIFHAYGVDYYDLYLRPYLGMTYDDPAITHNVPKTIARTVLGGAKPFIFSGISNPNDFRIIEYIPLKVSGDHIDKYPADKVGVIFYHFDGNIEKLKKPFCI